jgi:hypothetical protein
MIFRKSVKKISLYENLSRISGTLHEDRYTFLILSRLVLFKMRNIQTKFVEKIKTLILYAVIFFRKSFR